MSLDTHYKSWQHSKVTNLLCNPVYGEQQVISDSIEDESFNLILLLNSFLFVR